MTDPQAAITLGDLTVVIVTYNSAHCVPALAAGLQGVERVVVVDNASDDDTVACVRAQIAQAQVLVNDSNHGFGAANNRALHEVQTRYALLLNPDCLPDTEFFVGMVHAANQFPHAAVIAPHLLRRHGDVELSYRWPATHWISTGPEAVGPCSVGFVCGAVMLLNMPVMREVGFFDETFFLYYEDEDLCQRVFLARRDIVLVPQVAIAHLSRGSVKGRSPLRSEYLRGYHHAQSKLVFERKYFGEGPMRRLRWRTLALALLTLVPRLLLPQPRYLARLLGRIMGLWRATPQSSSTRLAG
jgi:N-acetylglucosaminyl-diphospho-decaprenol L-rhamnosyltransferase